ncbi:MAG TPA: hypothetical protein VEQ17_00825 [Steroidobacteraceae bacterium]|nr:hypothetical protein [Steroidobacteraceae bacterium]
MNSGQSSPADRTQLIRRIRNQVPLLLHDDSGDEPSGVAIYTLADPRDVREVRYVGQTRSPRRRFLQHVNTARLWLPDQDETAWWVKVPKLRPLYDWIRELHRDGSRLPVMVVTRWVSDLSEARSAERSHIQFCLGRQLPLLNFEAERAGGQLPLALSGEAGRGG